MQVEWLGTASLLLRQAETCIAVDPYFRLGGRGLPPFPLQVACASDAVFITHPHLDHFADVNKLMDSCSVPVYVCERGLAIARHERWNCEHLHVLSVGEEIVCKGIKVRALQARHCIFDAALVMRTIARALHPHCFSRALALARHNHRFSIDLMRDVIAFEVCSKDAHLLVFGSAALDPEAIYPKDLDAVIWAYQGRSDMASYSVPLLRKLDTKRVILTHFDDAFPPVSQVMDTDAFIAYARQELPGVEVIVPRFGEPISIGR